KHSPWLIIVSGESSLRQNFSGCNSRARPRRVTFLSVVVWPLDFRDSLSLGCRSFTFRKKMHVRLQLARSPCFSTSIKTHDTRGFRTRHYPTQLFHQLAN